MEVLERKIGELKPYPNNPRNNKAAVDAVANSIREFGFKVPIIVDKDNVIVAGHTRLLAAKKLRLKTVPVVVADDLTEEQIKAFRLADNKVSELAEWDYDLLNLEIDGIADINMESFGFEFVDVEEEHREQQRLTDGRKSNILGLADKEDIPGVGPYDIPQIEPIYELPEITEWIGFNYVLSDQNPAGKGVHFFVDDYQFQRIWTDPDKYVEKLSQYAAVCSPDFSPYGDMPQATQIFNHYRKHWIGAYWQRLGVNIIPTIRASCDPRSLEWYLDGEPVGGVVMISSMWTADSSVKNVFLEEFGKMVDKLNPCLCYVYGPCVPEIENMGVNIQYIESFAQKRWGK